MGGYRKEHEFGVNSSLVEWRLDLTPCFPGLTELRNVDLNCNRVFEKPYLEHKQLKLQP